MPIDNIHEDTDKTIIDYLIEAGYSHILDFSDLRYEEYEDDVTEEQLFPDYEDEDEDEDDDTDGPVRPWWSGGSEAYFLQLTTQDVNYRKSMTNTSMIPY